MNFHSFLIVCGKYPAKRASRFGRIGCPRGGPAAKRHAHDHYFDSSYHDFFRIATLIHKVFRRFSSLFETFGG